MANEPFRLFEMGERPELRTALEEEPAPAPITGMAPPAAPSVPVAPAVQAPAAVPAPIPPLPPIQAQGDPLSLLMMIHGVTDPRAAAVGNAMLQQARRRAAAPQEAWAMGELARMAQQDPGRIGEALQQWSKQGLELQPESLQFVRGMIERSTQQAIQRQQSQAVGRIFSAADPQAALRQELAAGQITPEQGQNIAERVVMPKEVNLGEVMAFVRPWDGSVTQYYGKVRAENVNGTVVRIGGTRDAQGNFQVNVAPLLHVERPPEWTGLGLPVQRALQDAGIGPREFAAGINAPIDSPQYQATNEQYKAAILHAELMSREPQVPIQTRLIIDEMRRADPTMTAFDPTQPITAQYNPVQINAILQAEQRWRALQIKSEEGARYAAQLDRSPIEDPYYRNNTLIDPQTFRIVQPGSYRTTREANMALQSGYGSIPNTQVPTYSLVAERMGGEINAARDLGARLFRATGAATLAQALALAVRSGIREQDVSAFNALNQALRVQLARVESGSGRILSTLYRDIGDQQLFSDRESAGSFQAKLNLLDWQRRAFLMGPFGQSAGAAPVPLVAAPEGRSRTGLVVPPR